MQSFRYSYPYKKSFLIMRSIFVFDLCGCKYSVKMFLYVGYLRDFDGAYYTILENFVSLLFLWLLLI